MGVGWERAGAVGGEGGRGQGEERRGGMDGGRKDRQVTGQEQDKPGKGKAKCGMKRREDGIAEVYVAQCADFGQPTQIGKVIAREGRKPKEQEIIRTYLILECSCGEE